MNELRNSKSDDQLEELLMLTEQMQGPNCSALRAPAILKNIRNSLIFL